MENKFLWAADIHQEQQVFILQLCLLFPSNYTAWPSWVRGSGGVGDAATDWLWMTAWQPPGRQALGFCLAPAPIKYLRQSSIGAGTDENLSLKIRKYILSYYLLW